MLDLFAGTGALTFEALSRGAAAAVVVDRDPRVVRLLLRNAEALGLASEVHALRVDLLGDPSTVVRRIP